MFQIEKINHKNRYFSPFLLILVLVLSLTLSSVLLAGCTSSSQPITKTTFALDTVVSITYYDKKDEQAVSDALSSLSDYELIFSRTNADSELYKVNQAISSGSAVHVSSDLYLALCMSRAASLISDGKFDFTLGMVSDLWNFTGEDPHVPDASVLSEAMSHAGYEHVILTSGDSADHILVSDEPELSIDLGGMAKGYIGSMVKQQLIDSGVTSALINLGGNVVTIGSKPDGKPFQIGISKPEKDSSDYVTTVEVSDACVVTSGIYQRYFEENGSWYHHILDSSTGYPINSDVASCSIVCENSALADILSTTLFAIGPTGTEAFLAEFAKSDLASLASGSSESSDFDSSAGSIKVIFVMKDGSLLEFEN